MAQQVMPKKADGSENDIPRALLTPRERAIVSGEADVSDSYRYQTISRVRRRFKEGLEADMTALEAHGDLADEVRELVCSGPEDANDSESNQ